MAVPSGGNLGAAQGSITINTTQAQQAVPVMRGVAAGINQAMSGVGASTNRAQAGIGALAGAARGLAGAFGVGIGIQAVAQLTRVAVASTEAATAYERQAVAARSLAGSQDQVNKLLEAYAEATGGAVDKAASLQAVTRLQAIGFADNAKELDQFARAVRGISLAMGQSQEYVTSQLQLAIANQSEMRLDQIGFGVAEVQKRIAALRAENSALTKEMAYQQAILGLAEEKYGALADSAEGQASGIEKLTRAWTDNGLALGMVIEGPINAMAGSLARMLDDSTRDFENFLRMIKKVEEELRRLGVLGIDMGSPIANRTSIGRAQPKSFADDPMVAGKRDARLDWARGVTEINDQLHSDIIDQEKSYGEQRANAVEDYQQNVAREEQDFARNRLRQEQDLLSSIADIRTGALRREARMVSDLAETIAETREDTNDRLAKLDEDYQRNREKAARDHRDNLLEAAGRLDAKAVAEAQRNFKRQEADAKESHDKQRKEVQEQSQERIDEAKKAHEKQLADAREADAERIADMQADFALRQQREDEDRAVRLTRMAEDHAEQLAEMATANLERMAQIRRHAYEEREQFQIEHEAAMVAAGLADAAMIARVEAREKKLLEIYDAFWDHMLRKAIAGLPPGHPAAADPYTDRELGISMSSSSAVPGSPGFAMGGGRTSSIIIGDISVHVAGTSASASDIGSAVRFELTELLKVIAA